MSDGPTHHDASIEFVVHGQDLFDIHDNAAKIWATLKVGGDPTRWHLRYTIRREGSRAAFWTADVKATYQ